MTAAIFQAAASTDQGRVRSNNEDSHALAAIEHANGTYHLLAVADGMGGGARGEDASRIAIDELVSWLTTADWFNPEAALEQAFDEANRKVFAFGTGFGEAPVSTSGTTMVAALVEEKTRRFWWANVGDSRAYLRANGRFHQLTEDHSLVEERVRAGLAPPAAARLSPRRNVITRAIGLDSEVHADVRAGGTLEDGQALLLASDGLHGMIPDRRIAAIAGHSSLPDLPGKLVEAALKAGGRDNVTVLVAGFDEPPARGAPLPSVAGGLRRVRARFGRANPGSIAGVIALTAAAAAAALVVWNDARSTDFPGQRMGWFGSRSPSATASPASPSPTPSPPSPTPTATATSMSLAPQRPRATRVWAPASGSCSSTWARMEPETQPEGPDWQAFPADFEGLNPSTRCGGGMPGTVSFCWPSRADVLDPVVATNDDRCGGNQP